MLNYRSGVPYRTKQNKINILSTILPIIGFVTKYKSNCVTRFCKVISSTFRTLTVSVKSLHLKFDNVLFPSFGSVRYVGIACITDLVLLADVAAFTALQHSSWI